MKESPNQMKEKILYVLHLGFVELRNLAQPENLEQIIDLADSMEALPKFLKEWDESSLETVKSILGSYHNKYKNVSRYPYLDFLESDSVPPF